jgi:hypothetical protein
MALIVLGLIALGLTIAMFATKNFMLGFPSGIFWAIMGGYSYQQSSSTGDWQYLLFFAAMGMLIFSIFAAYTLRKSDLSGPDADKGAYIDEGGRRKPKRPWDSAGSPALEEEPGSWGDIDRLGMNDTDDRSRRPRAAELRERSTERRERVGAAALRRPPKNWGEFK